MANLKRTLALVIAVVMLVGMMAISAGAAFTDADEIEYDQAVEVMVAAGVITGYEDGSFGPANILNRAEAATIITRLIGMGKASGKSTFTDVIGDFAWADSYVAVCQAEGIVAGNGDGTFGPGDPLTGYAWAKMLLCAIGYNAEKEGMVGEAWQSGVYKLMKSTGLIDAIEDFDGEAEINRDAACQLACWAAVSHTPDDAFALRTWETNGSVKGSDLEIDLGGYYDVDSHGTTLLDELGIFISDDSDDFEDEFGNPIATLVDKKGETVAIIREEPLMTYTAKTTAKQIAADFSGYKYHGSKVTATNSDIISLAGNTGNGIIVNIYGDENEKTIYEYVVIELYVDVVTAITTDKTTGDVTYTIKALDGSDCGDWTDYADEEAEDEIFFENAPKKGDIVSVAWDRDSYPHLYPTTTFEGACTAKTSKGVYTIAGTKYELVDEGIYTGSSYLSDEVVVDAKTDKTFYVDQYGYIAAVKDIQGVASTDYALILQTAKIAGKGGVDSTKPTYEARVLLADGTVGVYNLAVKSGKFTNSWEEDEYELLVNVVFGYTLDDDTLTLEDLNDTLVAGKAFVEKTTGVKKGATASASGKSLFTTNTKVYVINTKAGDKNQWKVTSYTGTSSVAAQFGGVNTETLNAYAVGVANKTATNATASVVFVLANGSAETEQTTNYVFIDAATYEQTGTGYTYTGIDKNGEEVEVTSKTALTTSTLYYYNKDMSVGAQVTTSATILKGTFTVDGDGALLKVGDSAYYNFDEDTASIIYIEDAKEVNGGYGWAFINAKTNEVEVLYVFDVVL